MAGTEASTQMAAPGRGSHLESWAPSAPHTAPVKETRMQTQQKGTGVAGGGGDTGHHQHIFENSRDDNKTQRDGVIFNGARNQTAGTSWTDTPHHHHTTQSSPWGGRQPSCSSPRWEAVPETCTRICLDQNKTQNKHKSELSVRRHGFVDTWSPVCTHGFAETQSLC